MQKLEYLVSVVLALLVLGGLVTWIQASHNGDRRAFSCRPGKASAPVFLKGMSVYPRCPGGKQS